MLSYDRWMISTSSYYMPYCVTLSILYGLFSMLVCSFTYFLLLLLLRWLVSSPLASDPVSDLRYLYRWKTAISKLIWIVETENISTSSLWNIDIHVYMKKNGKKSAKVLDTHNWAKVKVTDQLIMVYRLPIQRIQRFITFLNYKAIPWWLYFINSQSRHKMAFCE